VPVEIEEILKELERNRGYFPHEAFKAAVERRDEIIPHLLDFLKLAIHHKEEIEADESYFAHIHALLLLAQFKATESYPLICELFAGVGDTMDSMGDVVTEEAGSVLASVCGGDTEPIKTIIENTSLNEYVRCQGLIAFVILAVAGVKTREEVVGYFRELFNGRLERDYSYVWSELACCCADLYARELTAEVDAALEEDLIDFSVIGKEELRRDLNADEDLKRKLMTRNASKYRLIDDAAGELADWACFKLEEEYPESNGVDPLLPYLDEDDPFDDEHGDAYPNPPARNSGPKIGRNDPCPCGSGKKYKKCCGGNE
jgi:hypothetical protein